MSGLRRGPVASQSLWRRIRQATPSRNTSVGLPETPAVHGEGIARACWDVRESLFLMRSRRTYKKASTLEWDKGFPKAWLPQGDGAAGSMPKPSGPCYRMYLLRISSIKDIGTVDDFR